MFIFHQIDVANPPRDRSPQPRLRVVQAITLGVAARQVEGAVRPLLRHFLRTFSLGVEFQSPLEAQRRVLPLLLVDVGHALLADLVELLGLLGLLLFAFELRFLWLWCFAWCEVVIGVIVSGLARREVVLAVAHGAG